MVEQAVWSWLRGEETFRWCPVRDGQAKSVLFLGVGKQSSRGQEYGHLLIAVVDPPGAISSVFHGACRDVAFNNPKVISPV